MKSPLLRQFEFVVISLGLLILLAYGHVSSSSDNIPLGQTVPTRSRTTVLPPPPPPEPPGPPAQPTEPPSEPPSRDTSVVPTSGPPDTVTLPEATPTSTNVAPSVTPSITAQPPATSSPTPATSATRTAQPTATSTLVPPSTKVSPIPQALASATSGFASLPIATQPLGAVQPIKTAATADWVLPGLLLAGGMVLIVFLVFVGRRKPG